MVNRRTAQATKLPNMYGRLNNLNAFYNAWIDTDLLTTACVYHCKYCSYFMRLVIKYEDRIVKLLNIICTYTY